MAEGVGIEPTPVTLLRRLALPVGLPGGGEAWKFELPTRTSAPREVANKANRPFTEPLVEEAGLEPTATRFQGGDAATYTTPL